VTAAQILSRGMLYYLVKLGPENLVFNVNLQEFGPTGKTLIQLRNGRKAAPDEAYQQIKKIFGKS
jgi:hypothetical protein